jgi:hypothetical protein
MHWLRARAGAAAAAAAAGQACWRLRSLLPLCVCVMWLRREAENEASFTHVTQNQNIFTFINSRSVLQLAN